MAKLTDIRDTSEVAGGGRRLVLPVKAKTTIYQGAIVALDENGYAVPGEKAEGLTSAGRAEETVENAGANGAATIRVTRGVFIYANSTSGAVETKDVLRPCYIEDDQTVTATADGASVAGLVISVDSRGVAVELGSGLTAPDADA